MWMEPDSLILIQNQFIRFIWFIHSFHSFDSFIWFIRLIRFFPIHILVYKNCSLLNNNKKTHLRCLRWVMSFRLLESYLITIQQSSHSIQDAFLMCRRDAYHHDNTTLWTYDKW